MTLLQDRRCRRGHHRPLEWVSHTLDVQVDWQRNYSLTGVLVRQRCPACRGYDSPGVQVVSWFPLEHLDIPNMCPKCHFVHDSEVRCP